MNKPTWLYDSKAGWTVHRFMYGYYPIAVGIARHAIRLLEERIISINTLKVVGPIYYPESTIVVSKH